MAVLLDGLLLEPGQRLRCMEDWLLVGYVTSSASTGNGWMQIMVRVFQPRVVRTLILKGHEH